MNQIVSCLYYMYFNLSEPEVGLLLDLDSPVIQKPSSDTSLPPANGKPNEELANQPQGDCDVSGSDPPRAEMIAGEKRSSKSSTEKSSLGSASLESPNWPDFTGTIDFFIKKEKSLDRANLNNHFPCPSCGLIRKQECGSYTNNKCFLYEKIQKP